MSVEDRAYELARVHGLPPEASSAFADYVTAAPACMAASDFAEMWAAAWRCGQLWRPPPSDRPTDHEAHQAMVDSVRCRIPVQEQAHRFAMLAKESVFKAQDRICDVPSGILQRKLDRRLSKIRAELEALDRDWRRGSDGVR